MFGANVAVPIRLQALALCRIGPHDPALQPTTLFPRVYQTALDPGEQAGARHR